jgi:sec-independent protein translocase protein TatC
MSHDAELTIFEHLSELRSRLFKATLALVVTTAISMAFAERVLQLLIIPLGDKVPQTIRPTESFIVYFRVALIVGVTLSMPVIVYQIVRYMLPGLLPHEKKYLYFLLPGVFVCFAGGVCFAAFLMLPAAIQFLQGFLATIVDNRWTLDNYIDFVTRVMFWMGIIFQTPLIMFFMAKLNLVTAKKMSGFRKYAIVLCAIIAAMVTPTPDPVNMMIVMVPLYLLYEVGIILARLAGAGRKVSEGQGIETTASGS